MVYADYAYYGNGYLCGRESQIPEGEFAFWEKQARKEIDRATYDRVQGLEEVPEAAKECACELAELLYLADKAGKAAAEAGGAGLLSSYNNDGLQASFTLQDSAFTESGLRNKTREIIRKHFLLTGLMYKGVGE